MTGRHTKRWRSSTQSAASAMAPERAAQPTAALGEPTVVPGGKIVAPTRHQAYIAARFNQVVGTAITGGRFAGCPEGYVPPCGAARFREGYYEGPLLGRLIVAQLVLRDARDERRWFPQLAFRQAATMTADGNPYELRFDAPTGVLKRHIVAGAMMNGRFQADPVTATPPTEVHWPQLEDILSPIQTANFCGFEFYESRLRYPPSR